MAISGIDSRIERIKSYDGTLIATACWGDKDLPTVVLSNGICCTDTYWTYLQPALVDAGYRVVFFDYRGHNRSASPKNPNEVTVPAHAQDLWRVAEHYDVQKAVLVGHSMGVQTIFEAYRRHPKRVVGLVALAGPYEYPLDKLYMTPLGAVMLAGFELTWKYSPSAVRTLWEVSGLDTQLLVTMSKLLGAISRDAPRPLVDEYFRHVASLDPVLMVQMFRGMQMHSARDVLERCDVPVLQIAGSRDMLTPLPIQRAMASMLNDVRFEICDKASHTLPIDRPKQVNDLILKFLPEAFAMDDQKTTGKAPTGTRRTSTARPRATPAGKATRPKKAPAQGVAASKKPRAKKSAPRAAAASA